MTPLFHTLFLFFLNISSLLLFYHFCTFPFSSSAFYILFRPFLFAFHCTIFFLHFSCFSITCFIFSPIFYFLSLFFTLPCPLFAFYVTIFCSSLNYKVCLCYFFTIFFASILNPLSLYILFSAFLLLLLSPCFFSFVHFTPFSSALSFRSFVILY